MIQTARPNTKAAVKQKTVTVVMPVRNEGKFITSSVQSVIHQDYPHELMEIIIIDGMSTDQTRDLIQEMQKDHANFKAD